ncbi:MAG: ribonuclease P protein component [Myxococcota bacterium]|nr:ribonuclease P protein component [Myxococcota bacterium]
MQGSGRKIHTPHFVLAVLPRPEGGPTRLGITVTRKIASAVGRNRVKRVMREVFRRHRELFPDACDVVAIAKVGAHTLGFDEVLAELRSAGRALERAHRPRGPRACPPGGTP